MHRPDDDVLTDVQHALTVGGVILATMSTVMEWVQILFTNAEPNGMLPVIGLWMFGIGCAIRLERERRSFPKQDP